MYNQSPIFGGHNTYTGDTLLTLVTSSLSAASKEQLQNHGKWTGSAEVLELARIANKNIPTIKSHDANGNRVDQIEFHPAWQAFMRKSVGEGLHGSLWENSDENKGQRFLARAAKLFMSAGTDAGHLNPICTTSASIACMAKSPDLMKEWLSLITSRKYDSSHKSAGSKTGITIGLATTERQAGSDLRSIITTAHTRNDGVYQINGAKWFVSAPMSDAFVVLANTAKGPTCFLAPRILPDGTNNGMQLQRLKDKLGNKSNASCEIQFVNTLGNIIGDEGQGLEALTDMQSLLQLDSAVISTGIMRTSLWESIEHCRYREVSGAKLIDQPLMQRVLADMALDIPACTVLCFRLAQAYDRASANPAEKAYAQLMTPVVKYWTVKIAPTLIAECIECLGVNGYVEEGNVARHLREVPLLSLWEGTGNNLCLDALSTISKHPDSLASVLKSLERDLGGDAEGSGAGKTVEVIRTAYAMAADDAGSARILIEQLALTAAAAELKRIGLNELADSFIETRLGGLWRSTYGMLDTRQNAYSILKALYPENVK